MGLPAYICALLLYFIAGGSLHLRPKIDKEKIQIPSIDSYLKLREAAKENIPDRRLEFINLPNSIFPNESFAATYFLHDFSIYGPWTRHTFQKTTTVMDFKNDKPSDFWKSGRVSLMRASEDHLN
jgi:hypothetical protein